MATKRKIDLANSDSREALFLEIIGHLFRYNDAEKRAIADEAEVSLATLYLWCSGATQNPPHWDIGPSGARIGL